MTYVLLNYQDGDAARPAIGVKGRVIDLEKALGARKALNGPVTTISLVQDWENSEALLESLADEAARGDCADADIAAIDDVQLMSPLLYPNAIFCAGANYAKHVNEMTGSEFDKTTRRPYFFSKLPRQCVIGPDAPIPLPHTSQQMDWEVELAAVIGKPGRNIKEADALDHVAGYFIMNDISARDLGKRPDWPNWGMDWVCHKSTDGGAPMGPWMVPASTITNPHVLDLKLWLNGELQQDSNTSDLIFDLSEQIEYLSEHFILYPGDVISTGTPSGVGRPRGIFLKPGDVIRMEIEQIGEMTNPVVAGE